MNKLFYYFLLSLTISSGAFAQSLFFPTGEEPQDPSHTGRRPQQNSSNIPDIKKVKHLEVFEKFYLIIDPSNKENYMNVVVKNGSEDISIKTVSFENSKDGYIDKVLNGWLERSKNGFYWEYCIFGADSCASPELPNPQFSK